nr:unnamed protein product [Digitaria exilis]
MHHRRIRLGLHVPSRRRPPARTTVHLHRCRLDLHTPSHRHPPPDAAAWTSTRHHAAVHLHAPPPGPSRAAAWTSTTTSMSSSKPSVGMEEGRRRRRHAGRRRRRRGSWGVQRGGGGAYDVKAEGRAACLASEIERQGERKASAVLRSIAEDPPPFLKKKFDKILHIDCSRWKSRRALQREIAHKLKLPHSIMAAFDGEDEKDDFSGVEESSRAENIHVEIRQGTINNTNVVAAQAIRAVRFVMNRVQSLHVHNNSSITSIIPDEISRPVSGEDINYHALKWCHVESCPKLDTVFYTNYGRGYYCFDNLENFWAADLLMARSIWSRGRPYRWNDPHCFAKLHAIHLYCCPRLQFVLPLSWFNTLFSLETLHIVCCGDLKQVFPVEERFLSAIATKHPNGMLKFPKLKHLYLHDLFCLQQICEAKIFAPVLETVRLRGCWALRRLPATASHRQDGRLVAVDCERDWWEKLEWDGLRVGHHPSLFAPRHSAYYKKRQLRTTVLR